MTALVIVFLLCMAGSIFFSSSEMAFVSANLVKFRESADSGNTTAKRVLDLLAKPQEFLTAILIGNNIANITSTAIFTYWFEKFFHFSNEWVITLLMAPLLIIFCETVPKDYSRTHSRDFLMKSVWLLEILLMFFKIPVEWTLKLSRKILGPLGEAIDRSIFVSEKEFRLLIEESTKTGVIEHHEKQLIDTIMDFERIKVEAVMIPVEKVEKVDITGTLSDVKTKARQTGTRMVLVYEELPSIIVGMIYVFDILFESDESAGFKHYLRSPIFLSRQTTIEKAFLTLQEKRQSFAVVTDEDGEVIGVVPIEKLFSA